MKNVAVYNQQGKEVGKTELEPAIFGLAINTELVAQVAQAQLANTRQSIAHAKDRSEVRGGGKKPWRQKGTGRARHASIRSPLWAGGGVTFGPRKERNFSKKINKKMKKQALLMVLSGKAKDDEILILDELKLAQPKTKELAKVIKSVASGAKKDLSRGALIIMSQKDETLVRAAKNLPKTGTISGQSLNVLDLLAVKYLLLPQGALAVIKKTYGTV